MGSCEIVIHPINRYDKEVKLSLYPENDSSLRIITESEAIQFGESPFQLQEGSSYEYEIEKGYHLGELPGIITPSKISNAHNGRITPGIYTGTLSVEVFREGSPSVYGRVDFEVRSKKATYRDDYRLMLEDIAERCTELLMIQSSPVSQYFTPNYSKDANVLYQQFAFVKSVINSEDFADSMNRILANPVTNWAEVEETIDISRVGKIDNQIVHQIATRANRIPIPEHHPLRQKFKNIPDKITITSKRDSTDTVENQFVKFVLVTFYSFCSDIKNRMGTDNKGYKEAQLIEESLLYYLENPLFRQISDLSSLPLNNPVLQRKEGYREVLHAWLLFDLAAKLIWHGGDDVYRGGKRDIATLYEYWLFFKLLTLLSEIFNFDQPSIDRIIEQTSDGLGLKLKTGKYLALTGIYRCKPRNLNIEFSYNRTFPGERAYPEPGSWTKSMRPDYSLSIWPSDISLNEAEEKELIIHVHFDAKYKVTALSDIFGHKNGSIDDLLDQEKLDEKKGIYKHSDLLKMHAYKDAVRRTVGAYVLYPGTEKYITEGFHEVIPGLGAFPVRPSITNDGTEHLRKFILDVVENFQNRASQQERASYHIHEVYKNQSDRVIREPLPEIINNLRVKPPEEIYVIVGFCKNSAQFNWIQNNLLYNFRMDNNRGSLRLDPKVAAAEYLLIHQEGKLISNSLWKISTPGPKVFSKNEMIKREYPNPTGENYLVFELSKNLPNEFSGTYWNIGKLTSYMTGRGSGLPFATSMAELMSVTLQNPINI